MAYLYSLVASIAVNSMMTSFQGIPRTAFCPRGFNGADSDLLGKTEGVKVYVAA